MLHSSDPQYASVPLHVYFNIWAHRSNRLRIDIIMALRILHTSVPTQTPAKKNQKRTYILLDMLGNRQPLRGPAIPIHPRQLIMQRRVIMPDGFKILRVNWTPKVVTFDAVLSVQYAFKNLPRILVTKSHVPKHAFQVALQQNFSLF